MFLHRWSPLCPHMHSTPAGHLLTLQMVRGHKLYLANTDQPKTFNLHKHLSTVTFHFTTESFSRDQERAMSLNTFPPQLPVELLN